MPTAIRLNPRKADAAAIEYLLSNGTGSDKPVPWSTQGYYLDERPSFITDPLFHAGAYYVQDASSMFLEQALRQTSPISQPLTILDLCAAPGGKSTLTESLLAPGSLLVSNEIIRSRVGVLAENLSKWGALNVAVTGNAPADFGRLPGFFDVVVADVPCSGSGLFRKDPKSIDEWSAEQVSFCSRRQQKIIADVWPSLKSGGLLIYSTCSFSAEENEQVADQIAARFRAKSLPIQCESDWNIVETESEVHGMKGYRFFPDKLSGEGFYLAVLQKTDDEFVQPANVKPHRWSPPAKKLLPLVDAYVNNERGKVSLLMHTDEVLAFPETNLEQLGLLKPALYIKKAGVHVGTLKHGELIPHADLPLSGLCQPGLSSATLNKEQALQFLRKNPFEIAEAPPGWCMVQYAGLGLGWIKVLKGRINNHYPAPWRILHR